MERRSSSRTVMVVSTSVALILAACLAGAAPAKKDDAAWKAPARAARKKNPYPADAASLKAGRVAYVAECTDCHGRRGGGDGPGGRDLKTRVPDLNNAALWRQSDGELFWKLTNGRGDMPAFEETLNEEQRWHVINYARSTFAPREGDATVASDRQRSENKK
jgi:mono/diheme cytochrome c family protein